MSKRLTASLLLASALWSGGTALAQRGDRSVEATLTYGTEAFDQLDGQLGATVGAGYQLAPQLEGRLEVSYLRSAVNQGMLDLHGTRVPVDLAGRYLIPIDGIDPALRLFAEGGLEVSFDRWDSRLGDEKTTSSEVAVGLLLGGGLAYQVDPHYFLTANTRYHVIDHSYLSVAAGLGYRF